MTFIARLLKLTLMKILVTCTARDLDGLVMTLRVTLRAIYLPMLPLEFEATDVVVKVWNQPTFSANMTLRARIAFELLLMNGRVTKATCPLRVILGLCAGGVAAITRLLLMTPGQLEASHAVVEASVLPTCGAMALTTGCVAEGVSMGIIFSVAAFAF